MKPARFELEQMHLSPQDASPQDASVPWWRHALIYQIYPLSFQDSDGDGKGDLPGIAARLDHLSWLGVDAVWLGPVHPSPMKDFGYDIEDFTGIDPVFGTLVDFERLLALLHARGIRLILDFVPNHTSDRHPWFQASRASRSDARRDWYVWADPAPDGGPPNNWLSRFGGSAWAWDEATGQYYYHAFLKEQPDLNWRNPDVRAAMCEVMRTWLRRGVDGFRIDAAAVLAEDRYLRNDPPNPEADKAPPPERYKRVYTNYRPEVLDWLAELRQAVEPFGDRVLLGEVDTSGDRIADFYGSAERPILHLPLNYGLLDAPWEADGVRRMLEDYLELVLAQGWPNWVIGGHDKKRMHDLRGPEHLRVVAMMLLTLPGTSILYAGEEIGMRGAHVEQPHDPFELLVPGWGLDRDPQRSPMQWDATANAGFTRGQPWLPAAEGFEHCNVAAQREDAGSLLTLYRELIRLRRSDAALREGAFEHPFAAGTVLGYTRRHRNRCLLVLLNLGGTRQMVRRPDGCRANVLLATTQAPQHAAALDGTVPCEAHQGLIITLA
ncbi:Oligo-1,6-glucosidase [Variovorax sp. PBL-H6]|uniref:alpha-amylase family glycosyl hydrolase n=1 Tax=Variovorax sp. PBL-H6 TaxID=434009 RepID=UPI001317A7AE|nr:alpha-amylase family glycosyl hydrolase [Variovorax sp. PBL-H6]VTU37365.1 Oligo-1,6-glucosidase [Variovorax sp. PBL-H6]